MTLAFYFLRSALTDWLEPDADGDLRFVGAYVGKPPTDFARHLDRSSTEPLPDCLPGRRSPL